MAYFPNPGNVLSVLSSLYEKTMPAGHSNPLQNQISAVAASVLHSSSWTVSDSNSGSAIVNAPSINFDNDDNSDIIALTFPEFHKMDNVRNVHQPMENFFIRRARAGIEEDEIEPIFFSTGDFNLISYSFLGRFLTSKESVDSFKKKFEEILDYEKEIIAANVCSYLPAYPCAFSLIEFLCANSKRASEGIFYAAAIFNNVERLEDCIKELRLLPKDENQRSALSLCPRATLEGLLKKKIISQETVEYFTLERQYYKTLTKTGSDIRKAKSRDFLAVLLKDGMITIDVFNRHMSIRNDLQSLLSIDDNNSDIITKTFPIMTGGYNLNDWIEMNKETMKGVVFDSYTTADEFIKRASQEKLVLPSGMLDLDEFHFLNDFLLDNLVVESFKEKFLKLHPDTRNQIAINVCDYLPSHPRAFELMEFICANSTAISEGIFYAAAIFNNVERFAECSSKNRMFPDNRKRSPLSLCSRKMLEELLKRRIIIIKEDMDRAVLERLEYKNALAKPFTDKGDAKGNS